MKRQFQALNSIYNKRDTTGALIGKKPVVYCTIENPRVF